MRCSEGEIDAALFIGQVQFPAVWEALHDPIAQADEPGARGCLRRAGFPTSRS